MADTGVNAAVEVGDLYLMANVHPRRSGLPFVVYMPVTPNVLSALIFRSNMNPS
jgi:hypothetical protein